MRFEQIRVFLDVQDMIFDWEGGPILPKVGFK
jgi:hypothetical protein